MRIFTSFVTSLFTVTKIYTKTTCTKTPPSPPLLYTVTMLIPANWPYLSTRNLARLQTACKSATEARQKGHYSRYEHTHHWSSTKVTSHHKAPPSQTYSVTAFMTVVPHNHTHIQTTKTTYFNIMCFINYIANTPHNRFMALFPGPPGWAGARRELLNFMVQGKINRGRHIDHPAGRHSIRTKQCPPPPPPHFLQVGCPSCHPTNSVKALKATNIANTIFRKIHHNQMAIFGDFFASRICSEPRAAHSRPAF